VSDFWEAVGRAALGRPGSATPRPRSIFEPEDPTALPTQPEAKLDEAKGTTDAPSPAREAVAPRPPSHSEPAAAAEDRVAVPVRNEGEQPARSFDASPAPHVERQAPPAAPASAAVSRADAAQQSVVELLEVQRIESTQIRTEPVANTTVTGSPSPAPTAPESRAQALSSAVTVVPELEERANDTPASPSEVPLPVVAEPHVAVTELVAARAVSTEPPLVIEIDHIDIRIEPERALPLIRERRRDPGTAPSLTEYLARHAAPSR